ncbi:MAG: hypothetical protein ACYCYO_04505 [Bacilli bacterium]
MATLLRGPNSRHTVQASRDKAMTVTQHLNELRRRLLWAIAGAAVAHSAPWGAVSAYLCQSGPSRLGRQEAGQIIASATAPNRG